MVNILIGFVVIATLLLISILFPLQVAWAGISIMVLGGCWMIGDIVKDMFS